MSHELKTCALVLEKDGKVLLQLRRKDSKLFPMCWGLFGGKFELDETKEQAIRREIKEELHYCLDNPGYMGNYDYDGYEVHVFRMIDDGFIIPDEFDGEDARFFSLEEVKGLKTAFHSKEIIQEYYKKYHSS